MNSESTKEDLELDNLKNYADNILSQKNTNHYQMEELIERLKSICEEVELISEITAKHGNKNIGDMLLYKNIEDGILKNLHKASEFQLTHLKKEFNWQYYDKKIIHKLIDSELIRCVRREKLKKISKIK